MFLSLQVRTALMILVVIISFGLMFFVYRNNGKNLLSHLFALLNVSLLGWLIGVFLALHPAFISYVPFLPRMCMAFAVGINGGMFLLAYFLSNKSLPSNKLFYPFLVYSLFLIPLALSPHLFKSSSTAKSGIVAQQAGIGMIFFTIYTAFCFIGSLVILWQASKKQTGLEKKRIRLVFYGDLGMNSGFIFTVMLPIIIFNNANFVQLGPLYILFFLVCTAIAIVKYELFNIKTIATEVLILTLNSFLFVQLVISSSIKSAVGNAVVFAIALFVSYILLKAAKGERERSEKEIQFEALAESHKKLEELDRQKTEFITIAAHQLRTPVSIINNYIGMLQDGDYGKIESEAKTVLSNMDESNKWLVRLADEFLNIANIEQGQTKYHFSRCDLAKIVDSVVTELSPKAELAGLRISWVKPPEPAMVMADEEKIRACTFNLLDNAVKYGRAGEVAEGVQPPLPQRRGQSVKPRGGHAPLRGEDSLDDLIKITITPEEKGYVLRIVDKGIGFDKEDESRFFKKFSRGNNAKGINVHTGTGLGLYISRKFIEGHSGKVWAKSEGLGKGSEFGFWVGQAR